MSKMARDELVAAIAGRYRESGRSEKTRILDEFVAVTGYHRKHALRLLRQAGAESKEKAVPRRARVYDDAVREALIILWETGDRMCGKRLKAALPALLRSMEHHEHLSVNPEVRGKLLAMSAATIDRVLAPTRRGACGNGRRKRRANRHALKRQIPVRTFADWGDAKPGFFEADFVVHAGGSMRGSPIHSFVLTDVCSGWTEMVPLIVREQSLVVEALRILRLQVPVPIRGLDTDNDGAFVNETVRSYCKDADIQQTRSRPHHKNDQAWIEQKNGAVVRRLVGYDRFEGAAATRVLARLYGTARLYVNFFQPSFKLKEKSRQGAKVKKTYYPPATPCDRLLAHPTVSEHAKARLLEQRARLDPVSLLHKIRECQASLATMAGRTVPEETQRADVDQFLRALPLLWRDGEARPTHRRKPKPARTWRTRKDPFASVWNEAVTWLERHPEATARQLFDELRNRHPGDFTRGQLRTLQRRVRDWRSRQARALILPGDPKGAVDEWLSRDAAE
ncbi:MAG: DDE-type integrase/transposase/recombinase [Myxococcota bacterium]